jgi:hypothetical protein
MARNVLQGFGKSLESAKMRPTRANRRSKIPLYQGALSAAQIFPKFSLAVSGDLKGLSRKNSAKLNPRFCR